MTDAAGRPPVRDRDRRRRQRRLGTVLRWLLRFAIVAAVFAAGIALGEALHDNPRPGSTQTLVRTLRPLPLTPQATTVTVTKP